VEIQLAYGPDAMAADVPEANTVGIYAPQRVQAKGDVEIAIEQSLARPIDVPSLSEMVSPGETVAVLLDDHTRTTPAAMILPHILRELVHGGVRSQDITILITHGTHRLSREDEVRHKVGPEVYGRYRIEQHQSTDEGNLVYVGMTSRGTPVWINRLVVDADRRIGIGHVGPSPFSGYSGGNKLVLPGVAGLDTINANHSLVPLSFRRPGCVDLPCRLDIDEAGGLLPLVMVVNVIENQRREVCHVLTGTPSRVFEAGVPLARQIFEVGCPEEVDIAVTSGNPYEIDLFQAVRAVQFADVVVREGGSILLVAPCPDGVGAEAFYRLMSDATKRPEDVLREIARRTGNVGFSALGYNLIRIRTEKSLHIVTDGISPAELESMGFRPWSSLAAGVTGLLAEYGPQARIAAFPLGSATIPVRDTALAARS
jgi:nickel-dependent lactate racemase